MNIIDPIPMPPIIGHMLPLIAGQSFIIPPL